MNDTNKDANLEKLFSELKPVKDSLRKLFSANPNRFQEFSIEFNHLLLDYSKQHIDKASLDKLCTFAESKNLKKQIADLFAGAIINNTEKRPALHTLLREFNNEPFFIQDKNIKKDILSVLNRMINLQHYFHQTQRYQDIISLGIGGSDLGPKMVIEALKTYKISTVNCHFISNVDSTTLSTELKKCDPASTLCIINSKTFTTPETLLNAKTIQQWMSNYFINDINRTELVNERFFAVTVFPERAKQFGILPENIFEFWEFVGGRFSVWSAVGLPILLLLGEDNFKAFLKGANLMDNHFKTAPLSRNMPVVMALLSLWNINILGCKTQAIIPYDDGLDKFPAYLQQLIMESNGKRVNKKGEDINYTTGPIIWGGVGCNNQHAYMQLLHQGTEIIPVDFLLAVKPSLQKRSNGQSGAELELEATIDLLEQHKLLVASCLSQSKALMEGNSMDNDLDMMNNNTDKPVSIHHSEIDPLGKHKMCPGNKPSNTVIYPELTPEILGMLIALYEHKVFVQSVLWDINAFDQFGVELGKQIVKDILPNLNENHFNQYRENYQDKNKNDNSLDNSSVGLLKFFHRYFN